MSKAVEGKRLSNEFLTNIVIYRKDWAGSKERAFKLINNLKYATNATNIGDTRTLVIHPSSTIYAHGTEEQKRNAGVFDDTIRISVGIEDIEDLKSDFKQAVDSINVNESEE